MSRGQFPEPLRFLPADGEETDEEETTASTTHAAEDDKAPRSPPCTRTRALAPATCGQGEDGGEDRNEGQGATPRLRLAAAPLLLLQLVFPRPDGYERISEDPFRSAMPPRKERLAFHRKIVTDCLHLYNSLHPDDEYEPAPGVVTKHSSFDYGCCWTHGNFVARRKISGCFNLLPAPRTIFFFELVTREGFNGVVTCIPLDEPVTEVYNFLGFPLGWRTRRDGRAEKICKTCYNRCEDPPGPREAIFMWA